ncbi:MAG: CDP-alcohol phosphatidyltransferase family protein [Promethearchaeota archaeon]
MSSLEQKNNKRERQKEFANKYIDKPVEFLIKHNIHPNSLSIIGLLFSLGAAFFISIGSIHFPIWFSWPVSLLLFIAGAFDVFDGEVARRTGKISKAGAYLDSNLDRISDSIIILGLILGGLINYFLGYIIMFLVIIISYTRARAENEGVDLKGVGIMERAQRIIILIVALILESWVYFLSVFIIGEPFIVLIPIISSIQITWFFLIFIIVYTSLLILTVFQRIRFTFKSLLICKTKIELLR